MEFKIRKWSWLIGILLLFVHRTHAVCEIEGGDSVIILDIEESLGSQIDQRTMPEFLPIVGDTNDIDLRIQSSTHDYFTLEGKRLVLKKPLDRDDEDLVSVRLQILCRDRSSLTQQVSQVLVRIIDVNDNPPRFKQSSYLTSVSELSPIGTTIFRDLSATDRDSGTNGLVEYFALQGDGSVNDGYGHFAIDLPYQGLVTVSSPLDYEKSKIYYLTVEARDKAINPAERLTSTTTLTINIQDGDDLDPTFIYQGCTLVNKACANSEYRAEVTSGKNSGALKILPEDIRAEDRDSLNARIVYSFVNGTPAYYGDFFEIDSSTGHVTQTNAVERSQTKSFNIIVKAEETADSRRFTTAKLTIDVKAVDNNPPLIVASSYEGYVDENSPVGTTVRSSSVDGKPIHFAVTDADVAEDDPKVEHTFELTTPAFRVNSAGFLVVNEPDLDRDPPNQSKYTFQVIAHEVNSDPGKGASAPISISVNLNDVNDNNPKLPSLSPVRVQAGEEIRRVTQVEARDNDEGEFSRVTYSIYHVSNNGKDKFNIDPETGLIEVIGKVSAGEQYSITVQATDTGGRFSQSILDVIVVPGPNTGGPVFVRDKYEVQVSEGASVGSAVVTLKAEDPERDEVIYSIMEGNTNEDFNIDASSGTISVAKRLNREEVALYNMHVKAEDRSGLFNIASVSITVTDINDQNPRFLQDSYTFTVEEGVPNKVVGAVQARDDDVGINGEVYYSLSGNSDFNINPDSGEILTRRALDFERQREHILVVTAKDKAPDARIATVSVTVNVQDVQDEKPFFEKSFYEGDVPENEVNFDIVQVRATDPDSISSITYVIKEGDTLLFAVDPITGVVRTVRGLDYEKRTSYTLTISTLENDSQDNRATCTVRVHVQDRNDISPMFTSVPLPIRLQDTVPLGTIVTTVVASDGDGSNPGNAIRYEISGKDRAPYYFLIDSTNGVISVKDDLRKEPDSEYSIEVKARDMGEPALTATATITVYVEHIATVPPDSGLGFADGLYTVEVPENALANTVVKTLPIINKPKGNFPIECQIITGNEKGHFYVLDNEQRDCEVRVQNQNLDFEEQSKYLLTVHLNTVGGIFGSSRLTTQVAVNIIDQNDNRPRFIIPPIYSQLTEDRYLAALPSDAPAGTRILQVMAEDLDSGPNGRITYDLAPASDPEGRFSMDSSSGFLSNVKTFEDLQDISLPLRLKIIARDSPELVGASLSQAADVFVNIITEKNRLILVIGDVLPDRVLQIKDRIVSLIQQHTRLIAGIEKVVSLKLLRNNSIETDVSGSDLWFYLVEPETLRILGNEDQRLQMLVSGGDFQLALLNQIARTLGVQIQRVRTPHVILPVQPNVVRPVKIASEDVGDLGAALIVLAAIIAVLGLVGIVYHCFMWSRYVAHRERIKRMCVAPRYEPVYADSSLKEYETQVLQMSVPVDEEGSYHGSPFRLKNADDVTYMSRSQLNGYDYRSNSVSPMEGSSLGNASTARLGSCVSAFDENTGGTKNPLYEGYGSEEEDHNVQPVIAKPKGSGLTLLQTHPPPQGVDSMQYVTSVETTTEL